MNNDRFSVTYKIKGTKKKACVKARNICLEQTVEFPYSLLPKKSIRENVVGKIENFVPAGKNAFKAVISYADKTAANELTQLLNCIFGNTSIKRGIRVEEIRLSRKILRCFKGPRFGRKGLRKFLGIYQRPILCTALKPMGLTATELAELAYKFALGGIDIIKDDHGLTNQKYAPFNERVRLCSQAVHKANKKTGAKSIYVANITAPSEEIINRAKFAKEHKTGGFLIAPGITGFDTVRWIAENDSLALPVFSHPALLGTYLLNKTNGISHNVLLGTIPRLIGADAVIYPNFGGRFPFSRNDCRDIVEATSAEIKGIQPIFPAPGGGMDMRKIPEMLRFYEKDVIFLIGGGLISYGPDIIENCRYFKKRVNAFYKNQE